MIANKSLLRSLLNISNINDYLQLRNVIINPLLYAIQKSEKEEKATRYLKEHFTLMNVQEMEQKFLRGI